MGLDKPVSRGEFSLAPVIVSLETVESLGEGCETLNPMLDPLDSFLSLRPSEPSFLDQRMALLRRIRRNPPTIHHCRTPATEELLGSFT